MNSELVVQTRNQHSIHRMNAKIRCNDHINWGFVTNTYKHNNHSTGPFVIPLTYWPPSHYILFPFLNIHKSVSYNIHFGNVQWCREHPVNNSTNFHETKSRATLSCFSIKFKIQHPSVSHRTSSRIYISAVYIFTQHRN